MDEERSTDRLARYIIWAAVTAIVVTFCWYFRSVLVYIILAAVVSLLGRPVMKGIGHIRFKGKNIPDWLSAILTLLLILAVFLGIVTQIIPVFSSIISNVSGNLQSASFNATEITVWLDRVNIWLIDKIPALGQGFKVQEAIVEWIKQAFDISSVTSVVGSVASALGSFGIGLFSVMFIGFFFIKDETLFRRIIGALVPDKVENSAISAIGDIEHLLSRYFVGLLTEVLGVAIINFLGLWIIARVGFYPAVGIAFMTGLLNVIPYVGPWIGGAIGTVLGLVLKYSSTAALGVHPDFLMVTITLVAIFAFTQLVDNFLFQPLIYSTSIKSSPLEIFIVLLMAGHIGGILGMLVAIPAYTVVRVIATRFFSGLKPIRRLMAATDDN